MPGLGSRRLRGAAGVVVIAAAVGGMLGGVAWWALSPTVVLNVIGGNTYPDGFQPRGYIDADGIAALLCIAGGVATAVLAMLLVRRYRGSAVDLPALWISVLAGAVGAVALWLVGSRLGAVDLAVLIAQAGEGGQVRAPLRLRMPGVLLLWPMAAALVFAVAAVITAIAGRRDADSSLLDSRPDTDKPALGQG